ncbi:MAG TPA: beta-galactosidase [Polyangiales bacterium]|nr:beta-galactosidase [Polyangiales bacterium]
MSRNVYACWSVWFALAALAYSSHPVHADDWPVPGDPAELQQACGRRRGLETFCQSGYLGIESGYQAALLGSKLPVAPAAHVPWAKPYARGPIKLLIITTFANASTGSDVEQLAQVTRELQVDVRWLLVADHATTNPELADERYRNVFLPEQARSVLREDFDVILITFGTNTPGYGTAPAHAYLPDDVYQTILSKVQQGTGLVAVGQESGGYWLNKTPLAAALPARRLHKHFKLHGEEAHMTPGPDGALFRGLDIRPSWFTEAFPLIVYDWQPRADTQVLAQVNGRPLVMSRKHGQGRVVLLGWDGTLGPLRGADRRQLEHTTALALRALTLAARKEPQLQLELTHEHVQAGAPSALHATLTQAVTLKVTVRDDTFRSLHVITQQARPGVNTIPLPSFANGEYFVQAIASDAQGRALNWADQHLTVECTDHLTVHTDKDLYQVGETVHISATAPLAPPLTAAISVRDASGRVLAQETRPFAPELRFDYVIRAAPVAPHKVVVELSRDGAPLLRAAAPFFVPSSGWNDYENVLWAGNSKAPTNRLLRDEGGFTAVFDGWGRNDVSQFVSHYGQRVARLNDAVLSPALVQTQPLKAAEAMQANLPRAIANARRYGGWLWLLQDERHQMNDPGPPDAEALARFRSYLRAHYSSLAALDRSWGTRFKTWEEVQPQLTAAVQHGVDNLAAWVDFRLYVADQAFELDRAQAKRIRDAFGPDTAVGIDGFTTSRHAVPYAALDFGRLAAEGVFNFYSPYDDHFVLDSLIKGPKANYIGWSMSRADYFGLPWRDAFRGHRGSLRFFGPTYMSELGHLQPAGRWTGEGTRELRAGVGKLLIDSERVLSPVAILYSYASLVAGSGARYWEPRHGGDALSYAAAESRNVIEQLLWAAGVSFGYQTDAQVARGSLKGKRLLIIPRHMGVALSNATARAIEQFVRDGGTVLADLTPGLCDEHGKPRAIGALDTLFGVRSAGESIVHAERDFRAHISKAHALLPKEEWLLDEWYDKGLRVTDGRPQGAHVPDATPAFVVKSTGRGRALLLNTLLASQAPNTAMGWPEQHTLMRQILESSGVESHARVEDEAGERETHCEINSFRNGGNTYVGFYAHSDPEAEPEQVHARFQEEKHTYDVRAGRYLGRVRDLSLPLRAQEAALFARLDYKLNGLRLDAPPVAVRGEPLQLGLALDATAPPGRHVVHVEVTDPHGTRLPFYTHNVLVENGRGQLQLVSALNDPEGTWQVTAREVVSGLQATQNIEVR